MTQVKLQQAIQSPIAWVQGRAYRITTKTRQSHEIDVDITKTNLVGNQRDDLLNKIRNTTNPTELLNYLILASHQTPAVIGRASKFKKIKVSKEQLFLTISELPLEEQRQVLNLVNSEGSDLNHFFAFNRSLFRSGYNPSSSHLQQIHQLDKANHQNEMMSRPVRSFEDAAKLTTDAFEHHSVSALKRAMLKTTKLPPLAEAKADAESPVMADGRTSPLHNLEDIISPAAEAETLIDRAIRTHWYDGLGAIMDNIQIDEPLRLSTTQALSQRAKITGSPKEVLAILLLADKFNLSLFKIAEGTTSLNINKQDLVELIKAGLDNTETQDSYRHLLRNLFVQPSFEHLQFMTREALPALRADWDHNNAARLFSNSGFSNSPQLDQLRQLHQEHFAMEIFPDNAFNANLSKGQHKYLVSLAKKTSSPEHLIQLLKLIDAQSPAITLNASDYKQFAVSKQAMLDYIKSLSNAERTEVLGQMFPLEVAKQNLYRKLTPQQRLQTNWGEQPGLNSGKQNSSLYQFFARIRNPIKPAAKSVWQKLFGRRKNESAAEFSKHTQHISALRESYRQLSSNVFAEIITDEINARLDKLSSNISTIAPQLSAEQIRKVAAQINSDKLQPNLPIKTDIEAIIRLTVTKRGDERIAALKTLIPTASDSEIINIIETARTSSDGISLRANLASQFSEILALSAEQMIAINELSPIGAELITRYREIVPGISSEKITRLLTNQSISLNQLDEMFGDAISEQQKVDLIIPLKQKHQDELADTIHAHDADQLDPLSFHNLNQPIQQILSDQSQLLAARRNGEPVGNFFLQQPMLISGYTALMLAANKGWKNGLVVLLDHPGVKDKINSSHPGTGETALHLAAKSVSNAGLDAFKYLLAHGADPLRKSKALDDNRPVDIVLKQIINTSLQLSQQKSKKLPDEKTIKIAMQARQNLVNLNFITQTLINHKGSSFTLSDNEKDVLKVLAKSTINLDVLLSILRLSDHVDGGIFKPEDFNGFKISTKKLANTIEDRLNHSNTIDGYRKLLDRMFNKKPTFGAKPELNSNNATAQFFMADGFNTKPIKQLTELHLNLNSGLFYDREQKYITDEIAKMSEATDIHTEVKQLNTTSNQVTPDFLVNERVNRMLKLVEQGGELPALSDAEKQTLKQIAKSSHDSETVLKLMVISDRLPGGIFDKTDASEFIGFNISKQELLSAAYYLVFHSDDLARSSKNVLINSNDSFKKGTAFATLISTEKPWLRKARFVENPGAARNFTFAEPEEPPTWYDPDNLGYTTAERTDTSTYGLSIERAADLELKDEDAPLHGGTNTITSSYGAGFKLTFAARGFTANPPNHKVHSHSVNASTPFLAAQRADGLAHTPSGRLVNPDTPQEMKASDEGPTNS